MTIYTPFWKFETDFQEGKNHKSNKSLEERPRCWKFKIMFPIALEKLNDILFPCFILVWIEVNINCFADLEDFPKINKEWIIRMNIRKIKIIMKRSCYYIINIKNISHLKYFIQFKSRFVSIRSEYLTWHLSLLEIFYFRIGE